MGLDFHRRGALLDEAIAAMDVALREEFPSFSGPTSDSGLGLAITRAWNDWFFAE
jgi:hypothetical protein